VSSRNSDSNYPDSNGPARLVFYALAGTSYKIAVDGFVDIYYQGQPAATGTFQLHIAPEPVPPFRVQAVTTTPNPADVTDASVDVTARITVDSDEPLPAGHAFYCSIFRLDGNYATYVDFIDTDLVDGTASSGTYEQVVRIPRYLAPGNQMLQIGSYFAGGPIFWTSPGSDLVEDNYLLPSPIGVLPVVNAGDVDTSSPMPVSVTGFPAIVDLSGGDVTFNVDVTVVDPLAGFESGFLGIVAVGYGFDGSARISGDTKSGTYRVTVTIPQGASDGIYYPGLGLSDALNNYGEFTDDLSAGYGAPIPPTSSALKFKIIGGVAAPSITVEQPADAELISRVSIVNFGDVLVGQSENRIFTIRNSGTAPLEILAMTNRGQNAADFVLGALESTSLEPGATTTFPVVFTADGAGSRETTLAITSNVSGNRGSFVIRLIATGIELSASDNWRLQYFGNAANSGDGADDADPDLDGLNNILEYAFGLNPIQPGAPGQLPQPMHIGNNFGFSFIQPPNVEGIIYGAKSSPNMLDWLPVPDTGSGGTHEFFVPFDVNRRMFLFMTVTPEP